MTAPSYITKTEEAIDWYERGFSVEEISDKVDLPTSRVREILREHDPDFDG
jgi:hypothetical protein